MNWWKRSCSKMICFTSPRQADNWKIYFFCQQIDIWLPRVIIGTPLIESMFFHIYFSIKGVLFLCIFCLLKNITIFLFLIYIYVKQGFLFYSTAFYDPTFYDPVFYDPAFYDPTFYDLAFYDLKASRYLNYSSSS